MKFNEKLIELRKKAGLSQEELGYKLDVTRQTVSKWELGETTPEMAKLVEMSKIFNITVDELTNDSEITTNVNPIIEDKPIQDKNPKDKKVLIIIVTVLIVVILGIVGKVATTFIAINKVNEFANQGVEQEAKGFFGKIFSLLNKAIDNQEDVLENLDNSDVENIKDGMENIFGGAANKVNASAFNGVFELYNGSNSGRQLTNLLEEVITSNKKEERKVTVKYLETETQDPTEIKNLKMGLNESDKFEVSFEYDKDGYIYELTIEKYENNNGTNEVINQNNEVFNQVNQFINDTMNQMN
ncbi:MAG: helix-turn-helix transcriptional regulator [Clostridia bacterium]|nr:helix-turn-helix transcriptional regulator [Clostridia bacterium]